jgi:peptidyl-prolyl cis-trans isomerase C
MFHTHARFLAAVVTVAGFSLFMAACQSQGPEATSESVSEPAAKVESSPQKQSDSPVLVSYAQGSFTVDDYNAQVSRLPERSRQLLGDPEKRRQFIESYVISELIFADGERRGFGDDAAIRKQVHDLERSLVIRKVMQDYRSQAVSDQEVRSYYDANTEAFSSDRVKVSHILVKEEALALEILGKVRNAPDTFGSLAAEHSTDRTNAKKGGDLGFFERGRMVKEFEEASFGLDADGEIAGPIKTRFGYHLIMRTGGEDGAIKPFSEVKASIRNRLITEKRKAMTDSFIADLKARAAYSADDGAIAGLGQ